VEILSRYHLSVTKYFLQSGVKDSSGNLLEQIIINIEIIIIGQLQIQKLLVKKKKSTFILPIP